MPPENDANVMKKSLRIIGGSTTTLAGVALLVAVSVFTDKSLRLIVDQATFHPRLRGRGVRTFEDLMSIPYGRAGRYFVLASMLVLAYGAMVAYLLIVKDTPLAAPRRSRPASPWAGSSRCRATTLMRWSVSIWRASA